MKAEKHKLLREQHLETLTKQLTSLNLELDTNRKIIQNYKDILDQNKVLIKDVKFLSFFYF